MLRKIDVSREDACSPDSFICCLMLVPPWVCSPNEVEGTCNGC